MAASSALQTSVVVSPPSMISRAKPTQKRSSTPAISVSLVSDPHLHLASQFSSPLTRLPPESSSLERINDRTLRHLTMYSPLIATAQRNHLLSPDNTPATIRSTMDISLITEFPLLLSGQIKLQIPVFTVWGACEDVVILEKFRTGAFAIDNLHVLDEATTRCLDVGGVKLRLLGLGGALVPHKMFDNGDGNATIAGGQGTMWTTALQIGELVDTAQRVFDPSETRLLVTHASPGREGIISQLALVLKADLTISAGLHFRYASSYNEFSVQGDFEGFRHKLLVGKEGFDKVWDSVKSQVDTVIDEHQRILLDKALSVIERIPQPQGQTGAPPTATGEEPAWKNCWNWNLCDAAFGSLVLDIKEGRISAELKSQGKSFGRTNNSRQHPPGFNYAYRRTATPGNVAHTPNSTSSSLPNAAANPPTKGPTPVPTEKPTSPVSKEVKSPLAATSPIISATPKEGALSLPQTKTNGTPMGPPSDKAEKEKQKKREKKEKKERAERETKDKDSAEERAEASVSPVDPPAAQPKSGKETPVSDEVAKAPTPDVLEAGLKSPTTDSAGTRTPTSRRTYKQSWTLFVRLQVPANETEVRDFFGGDQSGVRETLIGDNLSLTPGCRSFV